MILSKILLFVWKRIAYIIDKENFFKINSCQKVTSQLPYNSIITLSKTWYVSAGSVSVLFVCWVMLSCATIPVIFMDVELNFS